MTIPLRTLNLIFSAFLFFFIAAPVLRAATSLTEFGITWTFDHDYPAGQYANGDYWVVGPVKIISISPTPANGRNGFMINPTPQDSYSPVQSWDNRIKYHPYSAPPALPLTVKAGSSIMSSISISTDSTGWYPQLNTIAILTVVSSAPPAGSFRPPYVGTDKTSYWNVSQLNYSRLASVPPVSGAPTLAEAERVFERPWIEIDTTWAGRAIHPAKNEIGPYTAQDTNYGRDIAYSANRALLTLQLNYSNAQKQTLLIRAVQAGIDLYGVANAGCQWKADGGQNVGRKMVMLLAGEVLGDQKMISLTARPRFQEDEQTWYVSQYDVGRTLVSPTDDYGRPHTPYIQSDVGIPEWGIRHYYLPSYDGRDWGAAYRTVAGSTFIGTAMVAHLMGIESDWGWQAFFDYADRYYSIESANGFNNMENSIQTFAGNMWQAYRYSHPTVTATSQVSVPQASPSGGMFSAGQSVSLSDATSGTTIHYTVDGTDPTLTSPTYSSPILINSPTTLKAIGAESGMTTSGIMSATFNFTSASSFISANQWGNVSIPSQTGTFSISFDLKPLENDVNGVTGVGNGIASDYTGLACIVRLNASGYIDVRNGSAYQADVTTPYTAGTVYHVIMTVNLSSHTYSVTVAPNGGSTTALATNYAFRTEQASVSQLNDLGFLTVSPNMHTISNVTIGGSGQPPTAPSNLTVQN